MSEFIKEFILDKQPQFLKYKEYIEENDWTLTKPVLKKEQEGEEEFCVLEETNFLFPFCCVPINTRL